MVNLQIHYDLLWQQSLQQFQRGCFVIDPFIDASADDRFGLTLLARPNRQVKDSIQSFLRELKMMDPHQYYYPDSDIHVTVMTIISCYSGFQLNLLNIQDYVAVIEQSLQGISAFELLFRGITASPSCILVQGFPADNMLERMRANLRKNFKQKPLEQSLDKRYRLQTAHATVVRFRREVERQEKYIEVLNKFRSVEFGNESIDSLELVYTDWYQRVERGSCLESFFLPDNRLSTAGRHR